MRTLAAAVFGAVLLTLSAAVAGGAVTSTHHGTFSGTVTYQDCSGAPAPGTVQASGTWNVAVHGDTATATFNIFTQESGSKPTHHVSYGLPVTLTPDSPYDFEFTFLAGTNPVHVYLDGTAFRYVVGPPYVAFGLNCPSGIVTYSGTGS